MGTTVESVPVAQSLDKFCAIATKLSGKRVTDQTKLDPIGKHFYNLFADPIDCSFVNSTQKGHERYGVTAKQCFLSEGHTWMTWSEHIGQVRCADRMADETARRGAAWLEFAYTVSGQEFIMRDSWRFNVDDKGLFTSYHHITDPLWRLENPERSSHGPRRLEAQTAQGVGVYMTSPSARVFEPTSVKFVW